MTLMTTEWLGAITLVVNHRQCRLVTDLMLTSDSCSLTSYADQLE